MQIVVGVGLAAGAGKVMEVRVCTEDVLEDTAEIAVELEGEDVTCQQLLRGVGRG